MTNLELATAMRNKLFADYGTDVDAAYQAASETINRLRPNDKLAMFVAVHHLLNTIANHIIENDMGEVK